MILDLIVLALFVLFIVIGTVRGAARTLFGLVSTFAAYLSAAWLAGLAATGLYRMLIRPSITGIIDDWVGKIASGVVSDAGAALPAWLIGALDLSGKKLGTIADLTAASSGKIAADIDTAVEPIIVGLISTLLTILFFLFIRFILRKLLMEPVLALFKAPVIGTVNRLLGAAIGAVEGLLIVSMLAYLLRLLLPHIAEPPAFMDESTIYNSLIFYHFYSGNIFTILASWVLYR